MHQTRPLLLLICLSSILTSLIAQPRQAPDFSCGFDGLRDPAQAQAMERWEKQLARHFLKKQTGEAEQLLTGLPYVVPVVVHIVHDGGDENIPDAQIQNAIGHLNQAFAAEGYFAQQGATVNTQIQFCLAKRDPDGNATTGITRTQSPLTVMLMEFQDLALKNLNRWNPLDYVNIWVVRDINNLGFGPGPAGYAYFPNAHGEAVDGLVCEARYFGNSPAEDAVLIHEMGHYFGLYHTFEGGCKNDNCQLDGDRVCDTPPDQATHTTCPYNSCTTDVAPGSPFIEDVPDFTGDFMDYSPFSCYNFFTPGQALRMQGAVETARKSLLDSKACLDPCTQPLAVAFTAAPNPVVAGQTVVFTNQSTGANSFTWSENGTVFSQETNTSKVFDTTGFIPIVLTAQNDDPNCLDTAQTVIEVKCPVEADFSPSALLALAGTTLVFTNTTSGSGSLQHEWRINGQLVGTNKDLSYLFSFAGDYTVSLSVDGPGCRTEKSVEITIASTCGVIAEPVIRAFTSQRKLFYSRDLLALPGGFLLQCGAHYDRPMVSKWDAWGNLLWHRVTTDDGVFNQILASPDGHFLLLGQANGKLLVAKMDKNGAFLWSKTVEGTGGAYWTVQVKDGIAVNPDGSFGVLFIDNYAQKRYLLKLSPDGEVLWSRKILQLGQGGSMRRATDGSGDFVFMSHGAFNTTWGGVSVLFFSQDGQLRTIHNHRFPTENMEVIPNFDLSVHADGGYSIFFTVADYMGNSTRKYLARFDANGKAKWAKRYSLTGGNQLALGVIRQLPNDEGWFTVDTRTDAAGAPLGDFLERLDANGQILWARRWGNTALNDDWVVPPVFQSGRIRGVHAEAYNSDMRLLTIHDSKLALSCVPLTPVGENISSVQVSSTDTEIFPISYPLSMADAPLVLAGDSLSVVDICTAIVPCPELCDNQLDDDNDGYVDCFDSDCLCTESDTSCLAEAPANNFSAKLAWQSTDDAVNVLGVPIVANLNPQQDNIPEIIIGKALPPPSKDVIQTLLIFKGDGSDASNPSILTLPVTARNEPAMHAAVADLDGNGVPELIVVTTDKKIRIYTDFDPNAKPCMRLWVESAQATWSENTRPYAADFNSDGIGEIYAGNDVFQLDLSNPAAPALNKVLDGNGAQGEWPAYFGYYKIVSSTAADLLSRSDCNGDPDCDGLEIVAGYHIYSVDIDPNDGDGYQIKIQRNLNVLDPGYVHEDGFTAVADLDLDGVPEIIVNGRRDKNSTDGIYVWNKNGFVQDFFDPLSSNVNYSTVCIANVYDDRKAGFLRDYPELIICKTSGMLCLNLQKAKFTPNETAWWWEPTSDWTGLAGATAFDFNGDGYAEIVYRDQTQLRIMYGGAAPYPQGVDSVRNWYTAVAGSPTHDEYPVVADVDGDGETEIAVTSFLEPFSVPFDSDNRGRLRVFESADRPWRPGRPVWNQFNYFGLNINDDLSVPKTQQKHWLETGGIGSGKRPFNTNLAQMPANQWVTDKVPAPDLSIVFDSTRCRQDSFDVFLSLCNMGAADLPGGTPIAFYQGNPTTTAAPLLFAPFLLPEPLGKGACQAIRLTIPAAYDSAIFAVVNDDGSLPRPFNLAADFPSTDWAECRYENNLASFSIARPQLLLDLGPDISLCQNSVVQLAANPGFDRYRWQDGSAAPAFTAYASGVYWVDAYDICGFRQTDTVHIAVNPGAVIDLPDELAVCAGGPVQIAASGFSAYHWEPADAVSCPDCASVEVLAKSSVTIHLTAAAGDCLVSDSVRVRFFPRPELQLLVQHGACDSLASITAAASGAAPFDFLWSDSSVNAVLSTWLPGTYTVVITDANGCQASDSASVSNVNTLVLTSASTEPVCAGSSTGSIDVTVNGGTPPFQFLWSNSAASEDLSNVPSGTYTVLTTDANGCTATLSQTLSDPPELTLAPAAVTHASCDTAADGSATVIAAGGSGALSIFWSNNQVGPAATSLAAGTYTATVTDAAGCTRATAVTIQVVDQISPDIQANDLTVSLGLSGSAPLTLNSLGATVTDNCSVESVEISPESFDCSDLGAQQVILTATDNSGNTASKVIIVTVVDNIVPSLLCSDPVVRCAADTIVAYAAPVATDNCLSLGGQFMLTEGLPSGAVFPPGTTTVTYTFTDAQGNVAACSFDVAILSPLEISLDSLIHDTGNQHLGGVQVSVSGSLPDYNYQWISNGQVVSAMQDLDSVGMGVYFLSVTDERGCTATAGPFVVDNVTNVQNAGLHERTIVFPNPTTGALFVVFADELAQAEKYCAVFDATGRRVIAQFDNSRKKVELDMSRLPEGLYSVLVRTRGLQGVWKIVVGR